MARGGRKSERDGPERRCIATGDSGETGGLLRFVVGPEGAVVPDLAERLQVAVVALFVARVGSPRQLSKLRPLAGQSPVLGQLFGSELGVAFGRDHVIHGALNAGGVTERVLRESARLEGFRPSGGLEHPDAAVENGTKESGADAGLER